MSNNNVRDHFVASYSDVTLRDPLEQVVRRGNHIRRARRARRAGPALVAAAAVALAATVLPLGQSDETPGPIELVAYDVPAFPLALRSVPPGLSAARFSLDPNMDGTGPGVAHAVYSDRADRGSGVSIHIHGPDRPDGLGDKVGKVAIGGVDATVYEFSNSADEPSVTVAWERREDQWVTVSGKGRRADREGIVALATDLVDRPTEVPLQLSVAPAGWEVVAYKEDVILTLADPRSKDHTRSLTVRLTKDPTPREALAAQLEAVTGPLRPVRVHGQPAELLPTASGWYLQARLPDRTTFVLQAPKDLTQEDVLAIAAGVERSRR
jgi:hypothetical protein